MVRSDGLTTYAFECPEHVLVGQLVPLGLRVVDGFFGDLCGWAVEVPRVRQSERSCCFKMRLVVQMRQNALWRNRF